MLIGAYAVKKGSLESTILLIILIGGFIVATARLNLVNAATSVNGIITSDTTWTKANSPYTLTGPVRVDLGVTLTIEAGVTVDLNRQYIEVKGILYAVGSPTDQIQIANGRITYHYNSTSWNEQTGSGNILENAVLNEVSITIQATSPKISKNSINGHIYVQDNDVAPGVFTHASPTISYNNISRSSGHSGGIGNLGYSSIITNNIIRGAGISSTPREPGGIATIAYNLILDSDSGVAGPGNNRIYSNIISNCDKGVWGGSGGTFVEKNFITNCNEGIRLDGCYVHNNTITHCAKGIYSIWAPGEVTWNNFENNEYNFRLSGIQTSYATGGGYADAPNNWWGTTDNATIRAKIFDNEDNFNFGPVKFAPILIEPNPNAMPDLDISLLTSATSTASQPSTTPSSTSEQSLPAASLSQTETPVLNQTMLLIVIAALLVVIAGLLLAVVTLLRKRGPF